MPAKKKSRKKNGGARTLDGVIDYRYGDKRKNIPPAKIAAEGTVPLLPKIHYEYSSRLPPVLRFDPAGSPDKLPDLLFEARRRPLTAEEAKLVADALRNRDPWLEWANKREKKSFEVDPVALHIHERISAQAILRVAARQDVERSLFADPQQQYHEAVQFYRHDIDWTNRLILGDSLQVMTSLAKREDLAGKVQMIYMDPPYGIKFGSNFQPRVGNRDVKDSEQDLTRELEMVKAYRDTWHLGIHSYLSYMRDRLLLAKELLADTGSLFVQIGEENLHVVRTLLDEVFFKENSISLIYFRKKTMPLGGAFLERMGDYLLWYAKDISLAQDRFHRLYLKQNVSEDFHWASVELPTGERIRRELAGADANVDQIEPYRLVSMWPPSFSQSAVFPVTFAGKEWLPAEGQCWPTNPEGMKRLGESDRLQAEGNYLRYVYQLSDYKLAKLTPIWNDTIGARDQKYTIQTSEAVVERCLLMTTEPGDLVLDPTCGGGTTAAVAEQWGRRWITIDTSRVAVALTRQRLISAKYDYYRVRDESKGIQSGLKYKTAPRIALKHVANNKNLDPIFAKHQPILDEALNNCNSALKHLTDADRGKLSAKLMRKQKEEGRKAITDGDRRRWELPEKDKRWEPWQIPFDADADWPKALAHAVEEYRRKWRARMDEVNSCVAANADQEELVDEPEKISGIVRVSGPFTVEAVQPPEMSLGEADTVTVPEFEGGSRRVADLRTA
jgi:adenine-specific DNA-methyltransferase